MKTMFSTTPEKAWNQFNPRIVQNVDPCACESQRNGSHNISTKRRAQNAAPSTVQTMSQLRMPGIDSRNAAFMHLHIGQALRRSSAVSASARRNTSGRIGSGGHTG